MYILKTKAYLIVRHVVLHYTKLHRNLILGVDGLHLLRGTCPLFMMSVLSIVFPALLNAMKTNRGG
jgi:hypothetical protein